MEEKAAGRQACACWRDMEMWGDDEEWLHLLALTFVPGIGSKTGRNLLEHYGSAARVFKAPLKELKMVEGVGDAKVRGFKDTQIMKRADEELRFIVKNDIRLLRYGDVRRLTNCTDAPFLLYYKGTADVNAAKTVAIVGTRKNTEYGHRLCEELIEGLRGMEQVLIVSGLALGIDAVAHKKALAVGVPTIGVLGHGLSRIYPHTHKMLAGQMVEHGGLLTEFSKDTAPDRTNFPMRNRIVAGMCDVTVVVESNLAGGALVTAHLANGYNREVAAYPGRVNDSRSAGCNELIRTNTATMITKAEDLIDLMQWNTSKKTRPVQKQLFVELNETEKVVIDLLQAADSLHTDDLLFKTGLISSQLAATLLQLEMMGLVTLLPGKHYRMS